MSEVTTEAKPLDIYFFVDKYFVPLVERKWVVLVTFLLGISASLVIFAITKPEYISQATAMVEEPISKSSEIKREGVASRGASKAYISVEAAKLRSSSFASEVFRLLPEEARRDFENPLDLPSQLLGRSVSIDEELTMGEGTEEEDEGPRVFIREGELLTEMFRRIEVRTELGAGLIHLAARTLLPENGPIILRGYIDLWEATNLDENTKVARAERRFAEQQRDEAYQQFQKSQSELNAFKSEYGIPVEINVVRDMETQAELERRGSKLAMDRDRVDYLDRIFLDTKMQEAGIQRNIQVISYPGVPGSPSRSAVTRLMAMITLGGLGFGVGIVLLLDYIKGPIRHEKDIASTVPVLTVGEIPKDS